MLWPASAEYVALCRSQARLIINSLGASSFGVYLTEESGDRRTWLPVLIYPETEEGLVSESLPGPPLLPQASPSGSAESLALLSPDARPPDDSKFPLVPRPRPPLLDNEFWQRLQPEAEHLVFPLIYESLPLGVLVVRRLEGNWRAWEEEQLHQVADTLAIGCVMDQRHQWLVQAQVSPQQDVLANLLHQFRNPLMALQTLTKLLLKRLQPPDPNRAVIESIWQESSRLQHLVEQFQTTLETPIPTLPSPASPSLSLAPAPLTLVPALVMPTIQPLLPAVQARANDLGIQFQVEWAENLPLVLIDPHSFQEVVGNLLDNACKYTPAGGEIYLQTRLLTETTQGLLIADTGPGIPAADLAQLGQRGYRGQQAMGVIPGTGLGLAIAKNLLEQMGGSFTIQSPFPPDSNQGTAVLITLNNAPAD